MNQQLYSLLKVCRPEQMSLREFAEVQGVSTHLARNGVGELASLSKEQLLGAAAHRMKMVSRLSDLLACLSRANIRVLAFKGPTLSQLIYRDPFQREYGDLDLMVAGEDFLRAKTSLAAIGYKDGYPSFPSKGQEAAIFRFYKAQSLHNHDIGCHVDLHWKLLSQWVAFDVCFEQLWATRQRVEMAGLCQVDTFSNEFQVLFLAFHGSQDGWPKLKQLLDLALALNTLAIDSELLYEIAGPRRPLLDRAVSLAVELLGAHPPEGHRPFFKGASQAQSFLLQSMARPDPQLALLVPSLWESHPSVALVRTLWAILTPSIDDIARLKLPPWAINGYVLVRALRLLKKAIVRRQLK